MRLAGGYRPAFSDSGLDHRATATVNIDRGTVDIGPGVRRQKCGHIGKFGGGAKPADANIQAFRSIRVPFVKAKTTIIGGMTPFPLVAFYPANQQAIY